jgi:septum formation protein
VTSSPGALQAAAAPPVVLASASASRARLLRAAGVVFEQRAATVDEEAVRDALQAERVSAAEAASALAELKAARVAGQVAPAAIVLGADQILACDELWLAKPADLTEARAQLELLAGRPHQLATAVVGFRGGARIWHHAAEVRLWLRPCSAAFLDRYLAAVGEQALSSVGAYRIEELGAQLFARVEGDHFAIQGLPLLEVLEFLRTQGVLAR